MAIYLAVEAICGVPNDVKIVEPDLNYEIEELAIPKAAQPEREMSPGNIFFERGGGSTVLAFDWLTWKNWLKAHPHSHFGTPTQLLNPRLKI